MNEANRSANEVAIHLHDFKFTVPQGRNLAACVGQETSRYNGQLPVIMNARFNETPIVVATDGRIASVVPVDGKAPELPVQLPSKAIKAGARDLQVSVNGEVRCEVGGKTTVHRLPDGGGRFPNMSAVFDGCLKSERQHILLRIDTQQLKNLADAISASDNLTLIVPVPKKGCDMVSDIVMALGSALTPTGGFQNYGAGLIVPLSKEEKDEPKIATYMGRVRTIANYLPQVSIMLETQVKVVKEGEQSTEGEVK